MTAPKPWDFPYEPVPTAAGDDDGGPCDVVIATRGPLDVGVAARALAPLVGEAHVETLVARAPLFWTRARSPMEVRRADLRRALAEAALPVRYVASATRGGMAIGAPLDLAGESVSRADCWEARAARRRPRSPASPGDAGDGLWFLGAHAGVDADGALCGEGAGTRLAVIDDDAADIDSVDLDREVLVGIDSPPRASSHGALMVAWAVGCRGDDAFAGVAPAASPRLYAIPKPGIDVTSLPLALARAVFDGADVIACATYVEGHTSPMLDDALEVAHRLGRAGRGAAVVFPTGREASSPGGSIHSSWSLSFGDAASDPRAFCVAPSGRSGGWFLWPDKRGRLRPFANRGPVVRWLAPGDDVAYPFGARARLFHAESSGASAIAAGVLLLVLGKNPELTVSELDAVVTRTLTPVPAAEPPRPEPLADAADVLPSTKDPDGHDAKQGYGRMCASRACAAASDPTLAALFAIGEDRAARAAAAALAAARPYSAAFARFAARAALADAPLWHAARALARHARLLAGQPERRRAQPEGALARQLAILLRAVAAAPGAPPAVAAEALALAANVDEAAILDAANRIFLDDGVVS
jgi:hypothetical protein